jgi:hypothetical protein
MTDQVLLNIGTLSDRVKTLNSKIKQEIERSIEADSAKLLVEMNSKVRKGATYVMYAPNFCLNMVT